MKKAHTLFSTLVVFMVLLSAAVSAQPNMNKMLQVQDLNMESAKGTMLLSWQAPLAETGDFFLVEKLDENWDYIKVGEVAVNEISKRSNHFKLTDSQPMDGENYYRITLVKLSGEQLNSDLLIADFFSQPKNDDFEFLFNDKFVSYTNLEMFEVTPLDVGVFGPKKYHYQTLKMRRIKSVSQLDLLAIDTKSMVAINSVQP